MQCGKDMKGKHMSRKWLWSEIVCGRTVRYPLNEMGFTYRKAKQKTALTSESKRTRLQGPKEKQSWRIGLRRSLISHQFVLAEDMRLELLVGDRYIVPNSV